MVRLVSRRPAQQLSTAAPAPTHTVFLLLDADSADKIEIALAPISDVVWAETRPIVDLAEIVARRTAGD